MNDAAMEQLEESLRGHESLSAVDDFNALAKGYIESGDTIKTLKGELEGKVAIPGENATDDERSIFYGKTGRPDSPDKYDFERPALAEGREYDKALENKIRDVAHKKGVSAEALKEIDKVMNEHSTEQYTNLQKLIGDSNEKDLNALKDIWKGESFNENSEKSKRLLNSVVEKMDIPDSLGGKEGLMDEFKILGLSDEKNVNPKFTYFMSKMFEFIGDDKFNENSGGGSGSGSSDPDRAYLESKYPEMVKK